jgi:hypothetical protein
VTVVVPLMASLWTNPKAPPITIPPLSSLASEAALKLGSEQAFCPAAAIAIVTVLLTSPPAVTLADAKQSGVISEGSLKLTCHKPGNPEEAPA